MFSLGVKCVILFIFLARTYGQNSGDRCQLSSGGYGTCALLWKCKDPNRVKLKLCGFDRNTPIVCCPNNFVTSSSQQQNSQQNQYNQQQQTTTRRPTDTPAKRISQRKCREYSQQVTENVAGVPLSLSFGVELLSQEVAKCDYSDVQFIVGGEETEVGEFPHMAALGYGSAPYYDFNCGGSLISENFVLTSAHCFKYSNPVIVRLGDHNLESDDDGSSPVDFAVAEIMKHPLYRPPAKYHDIALIRLARNATFSKSVRPACLAVTSPPPNTKVIATGWGMTSYRGPTSPTLQKVVFPIVDPNTCSRLWENTVKIQKTELPKGIDRSTMVCAGALEGGKDACLGDSGGPLSVTSSTNECIHHVVGVTSFGRFCGYANNPGIYARVSRYVPWIESVVWPGQ